MLRYCLNYKKYFHFNFEFNITLLPYLSSRQSNLMGLDHVLRSNYWVLWNTNCCMYLKYFVNCHRTTMVDLVYWFKNLLAYVHLLFH